MKRALLALDESKQILNKSELARAAQIKGRQSLLNIIEELMKEKLAYMEMKEWQRNGKPAGELEHYGLTDEGRKAAEYIRYIRDQGDAHVKAFIRKQWGITEEEFKKRFRPLGEFFQEAMGRLLKDLVSGKTLPPNRRFKLEIITDEKGKGRVMLELPPKRVRTR